ncbi:MULTISPECIES: hypothetical protein [unclassified Streptomyces]|uniref:hypothetical protein n=1 Tax=unclassified Streptomyces TaxID=2593676 RepID=UPI002DD9B9C9|nr:hypothetical protein [Streptomyces sp. NBC_01237]WRZ76425.1 hypothetical protein OG251_35065 [Streptomyces sp. NBC_01237]
MTGLDYAAVLAEVEADAAALGRSLKKLEGAPEPIRAQARKAVVQVQQAAVGGGGFAGYGGGAAYDQAIQAQLARQAQQG